MDRFIIMLLCVASGYGFIWKSRPLVKLFGRNVWAERKLGPGGSETLWKIIGVVVAVFGLLYLTGDINIIGNFFALFFRPPN